MAIIAGSLAGTLGCWLGLRYRFQVAALITLLIVFIRPWSALTRQCCPGFFKSSSRICEIGY